MASPPQRSRGQKAYSRHQTARYAPKAEISSSIPSISAGDLSNKRTNPSLTTSLRSTVATNPFPARIGHGSAGGSSFVRYLPQDEAAAAGIGADAGGLDEGESQAIVDFFNEELSRILKMKPREFWKEVAKNDSIHQFLDSYLQFRSRWYDFPHRGSRGMVAGIIVGEVDLCRRVFFLLYRISTNKDPAARPGDCLSLKDYTALLQEKKLLDLPKLLDICAIYGHENGELTKSLVRNAVGIQPQLLNNLAGVVSHFLSLVRTMHERCNTSLEALSSSSGGHGYMQLSDDLLEVMDFINDAVMTFESFADGYEPGAWGFADSFETSYGNDELINALARLHDSLFPSMLHGFSLARNAGEEDARVSPATIHDVVLSFRVLSARMVKFGWRLLGSCYLKDDLSDGDLRRSSSKVFPASVEDPSIRGDILVQTLREMNAEAARRLESCELGTFAENIEKNHKIFAGIKNLCSRDWISLDEEQLQYLSRILKTSSSSPIYEDEGEEDAVLLDSKISQIKELFPDYGTGFLKACLEVYTHNAEEVIQRILEGTLHEDLSSLQTSAERIPPSDHKSDRDKGKSIFVEPAPEPKQHAGGGSSVSPSPFGRFTRKSNIDGNLDSELLDSKSDRETVKSAILAGEFEYEDEYEDEYDDSFDDLGLSAAESGFDESENPADDDRISNSGWNSQKKTQFYVKDGKNYCYKVSGSVAVTSAGDAAIWNQAQKELIHGLGRGGNLPSGAVKLLEDFEKGDQTVPDHSGRGESGFRGRGGRRGGWNHQRKDRALKKHMSGLSGH